MVVTYAPVGYVCRVTLTESPHGSPSPSGGVFGGLRKLVEMLATPLVPGDYLDLFDPLRAGADLRGRIVAMRPQTADSATVVIRPSGAWRTHRSGQYIRVGVDIDGVRRWRAYSLTGPVGQRTIAITVKAISGGLVSNHLVHSARPGELIMLDQAAGDFVLPDPPPPKVLFVTAGSGITPVMGMLRNHQLTDVVLVHSAPTAGDVIFGAELRTMAALGNITLIERHSDAEGLLALAELDELVPDWRERQAWVCGPTGLLDDAEEHWDNAGLADALHVERFRPRVLAEPGDGGEVTFSASSVSVPASGGRPLLEIGEEAGVLMPSGCRMGICYGCVSTLRSGSVRDLRDGTLTTAEENDPVQVQTCVCAAAGPCDIAR